LSSEGFKHSELNGDLEKQLRVLRLRHTRSKVVAPVQCMRARIRFSASADQYLQSRRMKTDE
jgi:hypothetical protein